MAHVRTQLRNEIKTLLSGATAAGTNVFANPVNELGSGDLPAILISTRDETIERQVQNGRLRRTIQLVLFCWIADNTNYDTVADDLSAEVETILVPSAVTMANDIQLVKTRLDVSNSGEKIEASLQMQYTVLIDTMIGLPETKL